MPKVTFQLVDKPNPRRVYTQARIPVVRDLDDHLEQVKAKHQGVTEPWDEAEDRPKWKTKISISPGRIEGEVFNEAEEAEQASVSVWHLLDQGTRIRYMQLSEDWASKTQVRSLNVGPGAGRTLGIDTKNPEGGIHAREWTELVQEEMEAALLDLIEKAYSAGFSEATG